MACVDELFISDTGTSIEFLIKECDDTVDPPVESLVNISSATSMQIVFLKPDGTSLTKTDPDVTFLTDGTDSLLHYLTIVTDLDMSGTWKAQAKVTLPSGSWYSSIISFKVKEILQ